MGGVVSFNPFNVTFSFFFLITITTTTFVLIVPTIADENSRNSVPSLIDNNGNDNDTSPPFGELKTKSLKPNTIAVVGVVTTMFSITFLILLYIKHCNGGSTFAERSPNLQEQPLRKNSGIDRNVLESLPMFRFGSLRGQKEGLDCAVCLTRFEDVEVLRLLPKCKHAFHVECVDTWLNGHSTCPLCRYKVDPKDIVHMGDPKSLRQNLPPIPQKSQQKEENNEEEPIDIESGRNNKNLSFRHSSGGEKDGGFLEIVLHDKEMMSSYNTSRKARSKSIGEFVLPIEDEKLLLRQGTGRTSAEHRLEHRIIVSPSEDDGSHPKRWLNAQPSDMLYLTSDMIITNENYTTQNMRGRRRNVNSYSVGGEEDKGGGGGGSGNFRSFSEIMGMSRFLSGGNNTRRREGQYRDEGEVSRRSTWISKTNSKRDVR